MREIDACHELGSRDSLTGVHTSEVVFRKPRFGKLEIRGPTEQADRPTAPQQAIQLRNTRSERNELIPPPAIIEGLTNPV